MNKYFTGPSKNDITKDFKIKNLSLGKRITETIKRLFNKPTLELLKPEGLEISPGIPRYDSNGNETKEYREMIENQKKFIREIKGKQ